jgi:DNA repair exonuclease SbcCD ATPase subunit
MFEKKYKMAKEDASDLRGALKRLEGKEFDEDITDTTREVALNENLTEQHIKKCDTIKEELSRLKESSDQLNDKINSISAEVINIVEVERDLSGKQTESIELIAQNIELNGNVNDGMEKLNKINTFVNDFNIKELEDQQENVQEKRQELEQILSEISTEEIKLQNQEKKAELLKEVPCGSEYSHCKFIRDAYVAVDKLSLTRKNCDSLEDSSKKINDEISELNPEKIESHLEKYKQVQNRKIQLEAELKTNSALAAKNEIEYKAVQKELEDLDTSREEYYENREAILGKESLMRDLKKHQSNTTKKEKELEDCQQKLLDLYKEHGSVEQKLISLIEQQQELLDLREDFSAYDLFMRCMHSNGISYDIIKRKLPVINNEIAKVLANVVDFEVFFENEGRHLKILIKHPSHEPRPIEMGSGAEKTIAAMAIRLALLSVSSLPKSNIFILDEPGTSLDADNMDGFVRILDLVKSYFKTVFLISHLESLKDCVDMQITIDKKGQYAHVMET